MVELRRHLFRLKVMEKIQLHNYRRRRLASEEGARRHAVCVCVCFHRAAYSV